MDGELARYAIADLEGLEDGKKKGSGSFGAVYEVKINGMPCIAKRLHDVLASGSVAGVNSAAIRERFRNECLLLSRIRHPNIVQFLGVHFGADSSHLTLILEHLHTDLEKCLEKFPNVPLSIKLAVLMDVSYGLLHLHSLDPPIVHRDLTASNVLLTPDMRAKIADLGVSRLLDLNPYQLSRYTSCPGTLAYMPPETLCPEPVYNVRLDNFSFGVLALYTANQEFPVVFYEIAVPEEIQKQGRSQLYKRKKAMEKLKEDHSLYQLVDRCLRDSPEQRPSTTEINTMMKELCHRLPKRFTSVMEMHGEIWRLYGEREKLEKQLSATDMEGETNTLKAHVEQYHKLVETIQTELQAKDEQVQVFKELAVRERDAMAEDLRKLKNRRLAEGVMKKEVEKERSKKEEAEKRLREVDTAIAELSSHKEFLSGEVEKLKAGLLAETQRADGEAQRVSELAKRVAEMLATNNQLLTENAALEEAQLDSEKLHIDLLQQIDQLNVELQVHQNHRVHLEELQEQLTQSQARCKELESSFSASAKSGLTPPPPHLSPLPSPVLTTPEPAQPKYLQPPSNYHATPATGATHPPQTLPATPSRRQLSPQPRRKDDFSTFAGNGHLSGLSDTSTGLSSMGSHSPIDPNLKCIYCGMQYREGEIQKFRMHTKKCEPQGRSGRSHEVEEYDHFEASRVQTAEQPPDPNLTCLGCKKVFGNMQIQKFAEHCKTCVLFHEKKKERSLSLKGNQLILEGKCNVTSSLPHGSSFQ